MTIFFFSVASPSSPQIVLCIHTRLNAHECHSSGLSLSDISVSPKVTESKGDFLASKNRAALKDTSQVV